MNKFAVAGLVLAAGTGVAQAGTDVNFGVSSEYVFRGVTQSDGAQVWGSLDYSLGSTGLYSGLWLSNAGLAGNEEVDLYAGYAVSLGDNISVDAGAIGYFDPSAPSSADGNNSVEGYIGGNLDALNLYAYYNFGSTAGDEDEFTYVETNYGLPVLADATLRLHLGYFLGLGDAFDNLSDDNYIDYGVSFIKDYGDAGSIALALSATTIDEDHGLVGVFGESDRPQFTVGWTRNFGSL